MLQEKTRKIWTTKRRSYLYSVKAERVRSHVAQTALYTGHFDVCNSRRPKAEDSPSPWVTKYQHNKSRYMSRKDRLTQFKLCEIIPERIAQHVNMFKVIRSNTEIAITPPRIVGFRSNLVRVWPRDRRYITNVKGQGHMVEGQGYVTYQRKNVIKPQRIGIGQL